MRWGALSGIATPGPASCLALLAPRADRRCQASVRGTGFPAPPTFLGSPPRWCPFPTVRAFLLPPRTPRKSLRSIITDFSAIHTVSTERMQLSAPDGDYPPANSQAVHKSPCVAPGTPDPAVASCNRLRRWRRSGGRPAGTAWYRPAGRARRRGRGSCEDHVRPVNSRAVLALRHKDRTDARSAPGRFR